MTHDMTRRSFVQTAARGALLAAGVPSLVQAADPPDGPKFKFKLNLNVGNLGLKADPHEAVRLARDHGYQCVTPSAEALRGYSGEQIQELREQLKSAGLTWGPASIGAFLDLDDRQFAERRGEIASAAKVLQRAGATSCMTWTLPSHPSLTYRENFARQAHHGREVGKLLADAGVRLGIEYVGTKTLSWRSRYPFARSLAEIKELIAEIGVPGVGIVLDTWHWWQAGDTESDVGGLKPAEIVLADLCDAPTDAPREQLPDSPRRLPCTTGVIDVKPFLQALVKIGYEGPVGVEPFDKSLGQMPSEQGVSTAMASMQKALGLLGS